MTAPTGAPRNTGSLAILSDVATRLAEDGEIVATISSVIEYVRGALGATEASLWFEVDGGFRRSVVAGTPSLSAEELGAALEAPGAYRSIVASRVVSMGQRIGVLAVKDPATLQDERQTLVRTLANLLAPELAHAEDKHRLTGEVARSARQVEAERRFTSRIIDSLPLGLYVVDREYRVQAWNKNRETGHQGVSRENAIGKLIFDVLHRQPAETLRAEFDEVFQTGRTQQFNIETSVSGTPRTYRITKTPMRLDDGVVTHVISIGEDITDWAAAQESWAQSEKLAAIGQLAAGVMHEVNNPLATVGACAESLAQRLQDLRQAGCDVPPQADEFTRIIDQEVQRCKRIVDSLLSFSRPKSTAKEPTDVNGVIQQTLFLVKHHARFKRIQLQTLLDTELPAVPGSSEQLIQVFMALLINAADAMNEAGRITIRTRRGISDAEAVIAEVIDEGGGIGRTDLPRIFEPFYTTKPPGRGTGLGLSVSYSIVASHGGRIEVDSAPGAGSTFRILLPNQAALARAPFAGEGVP